MIPIKKEAHQWVLDGEKVSKFINEPSRLRVGYPKAPLIGCFQNRSNNSFWILLFSYYFGDQTAYSYGYNYIAYAFSIIAFMLSTSLIHDFYKGYQITIMWVKFQYQKVSNRINMISTSFSLAIKGYPVRHY